MCLDFYGLLNSTGLTYAQNESKKFIINVIFTLINASFPTFVWGRLFTY